MSKTVERTPRFSKKVAQMRPEMPPPMMATRGSSESGAVKVTCSWLKVFLRADLLEAPYDGFRRVLEGDFWAFMVGKLLVLVLEAEEQLGVVNKPNKGDTFEMLRLRG